MADTIREWKDKVADCLRKGKYSKALQFCNRVLQQAPQDFFSLQSSGYIHRKLARVTESVESYTRLVEAYTQQGFLLRAIATCKVVLEIDPNHTYIQRQLADLYALQPGGGPCQVNIMTKAGEDIKVGDQAVMVLSAHAHQEPVDLPAQPLENEAWFEHSYDLSPATQTSDLEIDVEIDIESTEELDQKTTTALPSIPLFSQLPRDAFVEILEQMNLVRMGEGDWILKEGDEGTSMFTIARGSVDVLKKYGTSGLVRLAVLGEGAFFGEMSILKNDPRGASVRARESGELFEITKALLDRLVTKHKEVGEVLTKFMRQRLLHNILETSAIFKPFNQRQKVDILERFLVKEVKSGQDLIREGERSPGLFVVLRGKLDVMFAMSDGKTTRIGQLEEGEVFGEISCLYKKPAIATVRASTRATVLRMPREDFQKLVLSHPQVLELAADLGEKHLAETSNTLAKKGILL